MTPEKKIRKPVPNEPHRRGPDMSPPAPERSLHSQLFAKGSIRRRMGGTLSLGLKKGRLATLIKHGLCYIGGNMKGLLTICNVATGARIARNVKTEDLRLLAYNSWRFA